MSNSNIKILLGGIIGGSIGYFFGCVVYEYLAAKEEYSTEDDFSDQEGDLPGQDDIDRVDEYHDLPTVNLVRTKKKGAGVVVRNYSEMFKKNDLNDLTILTEGKYHVIDMEARTEEGIEGLHTPIEKGIKMSEEELDPDDDLTQYSGEEKDISIISITDYLNAEDFEQITLNYYDDDVVTDEHDNPISQPIQILGNDALVSFGVLSGDEDVVYVRNRTKQAIYEIVRTNKNYGA